MKPPDLPDNLATLPGSTYTLAGFHARVRFRVLVLEIHMPATRALEVEVIAAVFLALSWTTAILRCYVRGSSSKRLETDDWLAILALLFFTTTTVFTFLGIKNSMGMHLLDIIATAPQNMTPAMMWWFGNELGYVVTSCAIKMSVVVFLLRIVVEDPHRAILRWTIAVVILSTIGYFFFLVFQCSPVDYFWLQFSTKKGSCFPPELVGNVTYAHSAVNAVADMVLAFLPVIIVSRLQMNPRTKLTVSIILSMGIFACVAVIVRIPYIKILVENADDFLYSSIDVVIWSAIELGLAITAANLATLRPLFSTCLGRSRSWGSTTPRGKWSGYSSSGRASSKNSAAKLRRQSYARGGA
ncbi:integral membrane protein [Diplocarpon rosae]|nr:integral membrane protein [Diplocarpon rosae]